MSTHYIYLEVEGIQRFVFASTKLKVIRGGSALLDRFNRLTMRDAIQARGGEILVLGGGHCLARGLARDVAEELGRSLARELRRETDGQVGLSWGIAAESGNWAVDRDQYQIDRSARALAPTPAAPPLPPFVALCSSCSASPARGLRELWEAEPRPLCAACENRLREAAGGRGKSLLEGTIWHRLRPLLGTHAGLSDQAFHDLLPNRELAEIADEGSGSGYLAYLYCDGNSMGRTLAAASSPDMYGEISRRVDGAIHQAVARALLDHCAPPPASSSAGESGNGTARGFCADVLLLGGDDLVVALPADRGLAFTEAVLRTFHEKTGGDLRLSAGLVLAPATTPIAILQQVAGALLRSAKRYAYLDATSGRPVSTAGYVDFQELTSAETEIEREQAVTCRPYRLEDLGALAARARALRESKAPRSRLHTLVEAVHGSEREAFTTAQLVVGRARGDAQMKALRDLMRPLGAGAPKEPSAASMQPFVNGSDPSWRLPGALYSPSHRWSLIPDAAEIVDHLDAGRAGPQGGAA